MYGNYAPVEDVAEEASGSFDIQNLMRVSQYVRLYLIKIYRFSQF
jgi:hypothetical protein